MTIPGNLLDAPSVALKPGQLYAAVFSVGIGPVFNDEDVFGRLEADGDVNCLPPISKHDSIWGVLVRGRTGAAHQTIDAAFGPWRAGVVPGFAEATLTLVALLPVTTPAQLGDVTQAVASSDLNPGFLGIGTAVGKATGAVGSVVSTAVRDLIIVLLIVLAIVIAVKFLPKAAKA